MVSTSLDDIVRNILLKRGYPIHYYLPFLLYTKEALGVLYMDDLNIINTKSIPVDANGAANIPNDCLDVVSVNLAVGQMLKPLVPNNHLSPLQAFDSNFAVTTYQEVAQSQDNGLIYDTSIFANSIWGITTNFNDYGEQTGRFFGGIGSPQDTYRIVKERNQIQLNQNLCVDNIILCYVGNGMSIDAATQIDSYAERTIDAYAMWLFKSNQRTYSAGEAEQARQLYIQERIILRARLSDITTNVIRRIIQRASLGSPHN